jgi:DNA-binding NtrC family response regulator
VAYILVIEDASSRRDSLLAVLGDAGHQIEAVPGGEQVFSLLSGQSFDLVLLNIERAAGRGLEAGELIKAIKQESPETEVITGEPGSGKTLVARTLHALSDRRGNPLVVIPCAAIAEPLQESELFGRASRPSAGSRSESRGQLERAEGGMALLDEVGKLAPAAQAKLMRFLQDGELKRVGASSTRSLNVRVLAASSQDLENRVEQGAFREDLFYRLSVIRMHLAPLRERREDIAVLAQHFLARAAARSGTDPPGISPRALSLLMSQGWPGNVGELENVMERAIAQNTDGLIGLDDLPLGESWRTEDRVIDQARRSRLTLDELEREYILEVLAECGGSRKKTSERLGITTATLWRKLKQYEQTR